MSLTVHSLRLSGVEQFVGGGTFLKKNPSFLHWMALGSIQHLPSIVHQNGLTRVKGHASAAVVTGGVDAPHWKVIVHGKNLVSSVKALDVQAWTENGHSVHMTKHVEILGYWHLLIWLWHFSIFEHLVNISSKRRKKIKLSDNADFTLTHGDSQSMLFFVASVQKVGPVEKLSLKKEHKFSKWYHSQQPIEVTHASCQLFGATAPHQCQWRPNSRVGGCSGTGSHSAQSALQAKTWLWFLMKKC